MTTVLLVGFFGGVFIHVGLQSINGTAQGTMSNGIGSIIISLLVLGSGVYRMINSDSTLDMVFAAIDILGGLGC